MIKKGVILLLVVLGFSCTKKDDGTQGVVNLKVNDCFEKFQEDARICLDSVFNDSRCPTGLECVWEGDAIGAFTLTKTENITRFNLHANHKFQNDTLIDAITIKLLNISPYPIADQKIDSNNYEVEISVAEN